VTGASGAGKDVLTKEVRAHFPNTGKGLTSTTRAKRDSEVGGVDYHFYSEAEFAERVTRGEFVEHVTVHGSRYGTREEDLRRALDEHPLVISIMDPFGARDMAQKFPDAHTVFVDAPEHELRRRLIARGDHPDRVAIRMETYRSEILIRDAFAYILLNTGFNLARKELIDKITEWQNV